MSSATESTPERRWHRRARRALGRSIKLRLVLVFLFLAMAMTFTFVGSAQRAFSVGWREAARPLLMDYVERLAADITADGGSAPSAERARAITQRLPVTVDISGPRVNWRSHPTQHQPSRDLDDPGWRRFLVRTTADGHTIRFGFNDDAFERRPRLVGYTLAVLLLLTLFAYFYVRHLLRPLDDIGAGAQRFGAGEFARPIPVRHTHRPDELGQLAATINTMGHDIHQMLEAKRALLLAISHELRSPLTRARIHTELLPETDEVAPQREALLRDLQQMADLINDLLQSESLASRHAALHREAVQLDTLARDVIAGLKTRYPAAGHIGVHVAPGVPAVQVDAVRLRLMLRNLFDNALRFSVDALQAPELHIRPAGTAGAGIELEVRDYGPGVPEDQIPRLAEPFYRPDTARTRKTGGVGLGLYLCKLVAEAHGGTFRVRNAKPGLAVTVTLPC